MSGDPELLRLRALAREAEGRYFRLKLLFGDAAILEAAHRIWTDAVKAAQEYEQQKR